MFPFRKKQSDACRTFGASPDDYNRNRPDTQTKSELSGAGAAGVGRAAGRANPPHPAGMCYSFSMRKILLLGAALLSGCVIVAKEPASSAPPPPPPAPPPPAGTVQSIQMLRYTPPVSNVYEAFRKVLTEDSYRVTSHHTPGDDNWWLTAQLGQTHVRVDLNRHDHKTQAWLRVNIHGRSTQHEADRLAGELHSRLGRNLGEQGRR